MEELCARVPNLGRNGFGLRTVHPMQTVGARVDLTGDADTERRVVDPPDLVSAFIELLANHPDALVACAGDDGIVTTMPDAVPLVRHRVAMSRSVIDMVTAVDKVAVIATWERSRLVGGASTIVHLLTDPEQPVVLTIVDAVRVYGVHLAMLVPVDGLSSTVGERSIAPIAPRTARVLKTELAMITEVDAATTKILGWRPEEIVGRRSLDFIHPDDQERSISNWMEMLTAPGHEQRVRLRHLTAEGSWLWMEFTNRNLLNDPDHPRIVAEMLDISEELAAQEALRASEQRLRRLAESLPLGVVQIEADRRISYANARLAAITGSTSTETIDEQFCHVASVDRPRFDAAFERGSRGWCRPGPHDRLRRLRLEQRRPANHRSALHDEHAITDERHRPSHGRHRVRVRRVRSGAHDRRTRTAGDASTR